MIRISAFSRSTAAMISGSLTVHVLIIYYLTTQHYIITNLYLPLSACIFLILQIKSTISGKIILIISIVRDIEYSIAVCGGD